MAGVTIDILSESRHKLDRKKIRNVVEQTLAAHGVTADAEVGVAIVGTKKMTELHIKYLKEEGPTDVMSFPLDGVNYPDDILRLGDVVVCYPVAVTQAVEENMILDDKICQLVEHGCLHLLGIHHE